MVQRHRRLAHRRRLRRRPQQEEVGLSLRQVDRVPLLRRHRRRRRVLRRQVGKDRRRSDQPSEAPAPHRRRHPKLEDLVAGRPQAGEQPPLLQLLSVHHGTQRDVTQLPRQGAPRSASQRLQASAGPPGARKRRPRGKAGCTEKPVYYRVRTGIDLSSKPLLV